MARWQPGTLERLQLAALDLFEQQGYDDTTVADIAARAGLTERTFYRHFSDKREVLVSGTSELASLLTGAIDAQPTGTPPLAAVEAALTAVGPFFDARRPFSVRRQAVIAASSALRERELAKLDALTTAVTLALARRGVPDATATMVAQLGVSLFHVAFTDWVADARDRKFGFFVARALAELRAAVGPTS